ncbi:MAG: hypothetical protein ABJL44_05925 [Algibacter sp.]
MRICLNKNNYILYHNNLNLAVNNEASTTPKFNLTSEESGIIRRIDWNLNDDNYPINRKFYRVNELISNQDYIYN